MEYPLLPETLHFAFFFLNSLIAPAGKPIPAFKHRSLEGLVNGFERIWKEEVVVQPRHYPGICLVAVRKSSLFLGLECYATPACSVISSLAVPK
jgi:hypothetical protein